jgi:hypothetical protein
MKTKLSNKFHINYDRMCHYLKNNNAIISGSFVISCLMDDEQYGDLDIYIKVRPDYNNMVRSTNELTIFNKVFEDDYIPGTYIKRPCIFPTTLKNEMTIEYYRKLSMHDTSIDLVTTPIDPKTFIDKQSNFNFLKGWFDGDSFKFPFKPHKWIEKQSGKILNIGSMQFETYYTPDGRWSWENGIPVDNLNPIEPYTSCDSERNELILDLECQLKVLYPQREINMSNIQRIYIGKEMSTDYRLLKTLCRCLKYRKRGINIINLDKFFEIV